MLLTEWNWDDALDVRYEEGLEEGLEKGKLEIARKMKNSGMPFSEIAEYTGLPLKTIEQI